MCGEGEVQECDFKDSEAESRRQWRKAQQRGARGWKGGLRSLAWGPLASGEGGACGRSLG